MFLRGLLSVEMLQSVRVNVQFHGELVLGGYLFIDEGVQIKHDTLQMNDEDLRWFGDARHFGHVHFLLAEVAAEVVDYLA